MTPDKEQAEKLEEEYVFEFYDEDHVEKLDAEIPKIPEKYNEVDFEKDLNDEQLEIVENIRGPMLVIAGAGSGKTRTIVYCVAKLLSSGVHPSQIMLVTFTNKAAHEMIKRVEVLLGKHPKGIWAGTFHALANRFLRIYAQSIGLEPDYTIMDESDARGLMKLAIAAADIEEIEQRFPSPRVAKSILSYSINCNKSIQEVIQWRFIQFDEAKVIKKLQRVFKIYAEKKARDRLLDFDDLLVFWNRLLDEKKIAQLLAKKIKYILVDEYQDTNYIQDDIIYKIAKNNPEKNVIAVGDDAQSIYAFRGANFQNIIEFPNKYENCKTYKITYNYRSIPEILALANDSIQHNKKQFKKSMRPTRNPGLKPYRVNVGDDEDQAKFISNQILRLRSEGYDLHEIAILYRAAYHSLKIEIELQKKNIPYEVRSGVAFFEKAHIKDLLVHLRIIDNPLDEISWNRIFSMVQGLGQASGSKIFEVISKSENPLLTILEPSFFKVSLKGARIPQKGQVNLKNHIKNIAKFTAEDEPAEAILRIVDILEDYLKSKYPDFSDRVDDLKQLSIYAQNYPTIRKMLDTLSLNYSSIESKTVKMGSPKEEERPVVLSTVHRAKGLEWRVVFIPMLAEDFFPSSKVIGDGEAFEEERRVFYVAVTRAKDQLHLIVPSIVQSYRGHQTVRPSEFIMEISPKVYKKASVKFDAKRHLEEKKKAGFSSALDLISDPKKR